MDKAQQYIDLAHQYRVCGEKLGKAKTRWPMNEVVLLYEKGTFPAKVHSWLWVLIGPKISFSKISTKYSQTIPIVLPRSCVSTIAISSLQGRYTLTKMTR